MKSRSVRGNQQVSEPGGLLRLCLVAAAACLVLGSDSAVSGSPGSLSLPLARDRIDERRHRRRRLATSRNVVLVTGGAGFIGSHIAHTLLQRGDSVIVLDEMNDYYNVSLKQDNLAWLHDTFAQSANSSQLFRVYQGDIANATLLDHIFEQHRPNVVCHMAARAGVRPSIQHPLLYLQANVVGTTVLLERAVQYKVSNFVFASSSSVYGEGSSSSTTDDNRTYFSETDVVDSPISPYAATKKSCELMAYTYHYLYGLPVIGLRFFTVYGPRGRPDMAPYQFIDKISRGNTIQQFGDGSSSRDYTYIDDIVQGVVRALDRPQPSFEIFNLGKGSGTTLREFIRLVETFTNRTATIEYLPNQPGDVPYTCANISKARRLLDYHPQTTFRQGIEKTVAWYQQTYGTNLAETTLAGNDNGQPSEIMGRDGANWPRQRSSASDKPPLPPPSLATSLAYLQAGVIFLLLAWKLLAPVAARRFSVVPLIPRKVDHYASGESRSESLSPTTLRRLSPAGGRLSPTANHA
jgi:UDP-glucuronate 4-epimerase